ncbi:MAG: TadE/TadG family type IV pilus assembly protein [Acidimicrobiales bacterium]|jgi:Flp pilus assembly protein TadG
MVELAVMAPVLFALVISILVFGRVSEVRQEVVEASRAGAQAAAVLPDPGSAQQGAADSAVVGLFNESHICSDPHISTDVSHFYPGGYVTVSVACQVSLSDLSTPGVPGSTTVRASTTAPIDPYRSVT